MEKISAEILAHYEVRKSKAQKARFRNYLTEVLRENGYPVTVEEKAGIFRSCNVVVGCPAEAKVIFSAHYDTCARLPLPNLCTPRNPLVFLMCQFFLGFVMTLLPGVAVAAAIWLGANLIWSIAMYDVLLLFTLWWIFDGPANPHTANDNTSGVLTLTEILLSLPVEYRSNVCCVFFDNEERGLLGSAAFKEQHKKDLKETPVINFDCVADGNFIQLYPQERCRKDAETMALLRECFTGEGEKVVDIVSAYAVYPSDQRRFQKGVGVCALRRGRFVGYYLGRIHTARDTVLEEQNIELLRKCSLRMAMRYNEEHNG